MFEGFRVLVYVKMFESIIHIHIHELFEPSAKNGTTNVFVASLALQQIVSDGS